MDILEFIPSGRESAISRRRLEKRTGLDDRSNRELIERQRTSTDISPAGVILSSSHTGGYWLSKDPAEIQAFNRELISRIKKLRLTLQHNEQFLLLKSHIDGR